MRQMRLLINLINSTIGPLEFRQYDSTRMYYMVIAGLRADYRDVTYCTRRLKVKEQRIKMYHYDNLIDLSKLLEEKYVLNISNNITLINSNL